MKRGFYFRLARSGIRKNYRIYFPYILASTGMVMMCYILYALSCGEFISHMERGSESLLTILNLGKIVISVFALIFLFYTNSFLMKKRTGELGLYNVLGMDKRNISRLVGCECVITSAVSLFAGLVLGILFSKLAELCLARLLGETAGTAFSIPFNAISMTAATFALIFFIVYIYSLIRIARSKPLELLNTGAVGEKPPKGNAFLAVAGLALLAGAYYMAVSINDPLDALTFFFIAVLMVIAATNLLLISGSVFLCRQLQHNKKYYYKAKNFVSVSSMAYRAKRNGAGLAAVCILSTMVLVTLSSTCSLYIGMEDSLRSRFPRGSAARIFTGSVQELNGENISKASAAIDKAIDRSGLKAENRIEYRMVELDALVIGNTLIYDPEEAESYDTSVIEKNSAKCRIVQADEFSRAIGANFTLADDEVAVIGYRIDYAENTVRIGRGSEYYVQKLAEEPPTELLCYAESLMLPTVTIAVNDFDGYVSELAEELGREYAYLLKSGWYCGFDFPEASVDERISAHGFLADSLAELCVNDEGFTILYYMLDSMEADRIEFYSTYGGLFFVGIILSIVFLCGAVMIIYYKQISEGYEDQKRFEIMKKVGMTEKDIRRSINSEVLIVFFSPLLLAGIHLAFAFPLVWKILVLFNMANLKLLIIVTACAYLIFALFYFLVYRKTSDSYYKIVNGLRSID